MGTIYVDPAGSDLNDGTAGNPIKHLHIALYHATSGDVVEVSGYNSITNPVRQLHTIPDGVTVQPASGERLWMSACVPVNEGDIYEYSNWRLNAVSSANVAAWAASASAGVAYVAGQLWGAAALELGAGEEITKDLYMFSRKCRYRVIYKVTSGTGGLVVRADQNISGVRYSYDWQNRGWNTPGDYTAYDADGNIANSTDWAEWVSPWFSQSDAIIGSSSGSGVRQRIKAPAGTTILIQYVTIECMAEWTDEGDGVYTLPYRTSLGVATNQAGRDSPVPPTATALTGLWYTTDLGSYNQYRVSEGGTGAAGNSTPVAELESFLDVSSNYHLRFKVEAGKTLSDYTLLMTQGVYAAQFSNTGTGTLKNADLICNQVAVDLSSSGTYSLYNVNEYVSLTSGFYGNGTCTANLYNCKSYQPYNSTFSKEWGGGYLIGADGSANISTMNLYGCSCYYAGDDAYQPIGAGRMYCYGCIAVESSANDVEVNGSNNPVFVAKGFSGNGTWRDQSASTTTCTLENCALNYVELSGATRDTSTYTVSSTVFSSASVISLTGGATATAGNQWSSTNWSASLGFTSATDLTPTTSSDLYQAGTKWWSGPRPASASGILYPEYDIDAGGVQTTHSPHHPKNL